MQAAKRKRIRHGVTASQEGTRGYKRRQIAPQGYKPTQHSLEISSREAAAQTQDRCLGQPGRLPRSG